MKDFGYDANGSYEDNFDTGQDISTHGGKEIWVSTHGPDRDGFYEAEFQDFGVGVYRALSRNRDAAVAFVLEQIAEELKKKKAPEDFSSEA
jgi:hypothetical protein